MASHSWLPRYILIPLLALSTQACSSGQTSTGDSFTDHMYQHYSVASQIQTAVIRGDLDRAKRVSRDFASHQEPVSPSSQYADGAHQLQLAAAHVSMSETVAEAAHGAAMMAATCASCHEAMGGPVVNAMTLAPDSFATMVRHVQAADHLWLGLLAASDETWTRGAELLASGEVDAELGASVEGGEARLTNLGSLGREALEAGTRDEKAEVMGRVLATCAGCHGER